MQTYSPAPVEAALWARPASDPPPPQGTDWPGRAGFSGVGVWPAAVAGVYVGVALGALLWLWVWPAHTASAGLGVHRGYLALFLAVMTCLVALGVTLVYHRVLTHRAAKLSRWVAYPLVTIALPAGTPVQWVGNHRHHHAVTDAPADAHSPRQYGLWVAHAGWYIYTSRVCWCVLYSFAGPLRMLFDAFWRPQTNQEHTRLARDIEADGYYRWLGRPTPYAAIVLGHVVFTWLFVYALWGAWTLPFLYLTQLSYYLAGDGVNSILHRFGSRPFDTHDDSTNAWWLAPLTLGEAWHNNHHAFPRSIKSGLLPFQVDLAYLSCRLLALFGLAQDLWLPSERDVRAKLRR